MAEQSKYSWIQMHKELLQYLMGMQDRQGELIAELEKAGVERLWDQDASGNKIPLKVIDPFSFFFFIYKYGDKRRLEILQNLANSLGISAATDVAGIPTFSNLLVRIFQNQNLRAETEVDALWAIFFKVLELRLEAADYQEIQKLPGMALGRFSEALYLIDPERFICINIAVKSYLKEKYQIEEEPSTFQDYEKLQSMIKSKTDLPFYRIVEEAINLYGEQKDAPQRPMAIMGAPVMQNKSVKEKPGYPLNMILFGAPGTGKTYDSIRIAVEIADPEFVAQLSGSESEKRRQLTERYRQLLAKGRIVFCTFHQSMGYEDFIEGIKPVVAAEAGESNLGYQVEPGIFKRLCERAVLGDIEDLDAAWARLLADVEAAEGGKILRTMERELRLGVSWGESLWIGDISGEDSISLDKSDLINYLKGKKLTRQSTEYAEAILALLADEYDFELARENKNNYVIILDEINRANVPQIFGELITLIEVDKRSGMPEALEVILPYSKESFSVPANLYILGTMNTADRSVEALDTALRRRFSFREMLPDYDLLSDLQIGEIRLDELLKIINYRIEALLGKDHCLGHSYFLKVKDLAGLKHVIFNEIIPLLQEYFYGNFGRIAQVLGSGFVKSEAVLPKRFAQMADEDEDFDERRQYRIVSERNMTDAAFWEALEKLMRE